MRAHPALSTLELKSKAAPRAGCPLASPEDLKTCMCQGSATDQTSASLGLEGWDSVCVPFTSHPPNFEIVVE